MKSITSFFATLKRWTVAVMVCVCALALVWGSTYNGNLIAIAGTETGNKIQQENKNFVKDAADKVKETAAKNAQRVEKATDNDGSFLERKAKRDAARIEKRADEDAQRTQKAIDNNVNAVERTIDNIKNALSK
ncbi:hypothetical protein [Gloeothece verrucosa]|uniref:Uncharacterized protein n=1 Tax=Gloeothece verrucosa (strain PCC 7822) TaxID=497965 RepID=E0ULJ0_GLOV7|nr:hypothetical protein [Gloeothece verrucosa]ADN17820.1 conserved hypothetical protein [Gloeothece verrucosa PCC 7822]